jgi:hypothetical protein
VEQKVDVRRSHRVRLAEGVRVGAAVDFGDATEATRRSSNWAASAPAFVMSTFARPSATTAARTVAARRGGDAAQAVAQRIVQDLLERKAAAMPDVLQHALHVVVEGYGRTHRIEASDGCAS